MDTARDRRKYPRNTDKKQRSSEKVSCQRRSSEKVSYQRRSSEKVSYQRRSSDKVRLSERSSSKELLVGKLADDLLANPSLHVALDLACNGIQANPSLKVSQSHAHLDLLANPSLRSVRDHAHRELLLRAQRNSYTYQKYYATSLNKSEDENVSHNNNTMQRDRRGWQLAQKQKNPPKEEVKQTRHIKDQYSLLAEDFLSGINSHKTLTKRLKSAIEIIEVFIHYLQTISKAPTKNQVTYKGPQKSRYIPTNTTSRSLQGRSDHSGSFHGQIGMLLSGSSQYQSGMLSYGPSFLEPLHFTEVQNESKMLKGSAHPYPTNRMYPCVDTVHATNSFTTTNNEKSRSSFLADPRLRSDKPRSSLMVDPRLKNIQPRSSLVVDPHSKANGPMPSLLLDPRLTRIPASQRGHLCKEGGDMKRGQTTATTDAMSRDATAHQPFVNQRVHYPERKFFSILGETPVPPTPIGTQQVSLQAVMPTQQLQKLVGMAYFLLERRQWDPDEQLFEYKAIADVNLQYEALKVPCYTEVNNSLYNVVLHATYELFC